MLENKNHKKISLSGKSLLMGTLSTAAIVLSASTANAATTNADNVDNVNVSQVTTINAPASVTKNDNSELKEDTTNKKVARTETNTSLNSSKEINSQVNESKEDSSSAQVGGAPVSTDNDKEENSSDLNQDSNNISDHFKDNDAQGQSSNSSAKTYGTAYLGSLLTRACPIASKSFNVNLVPSCGSSSKLTLFKLLI